jgi:hypothetical protein
VDFADEAEDRGKDAVGWFAPPIEVIRFETGLFSTERWASVMATILNTRVSCMIIVTVVMRTLISRASPSCSLREGTWTAMKFACWETTRRSNRVSRLSRVPSGWHGLVLAVPAGTQRANLYQPCQKASRIRGTLRVLSWRNGTCRPALARAASPRGLSALIEKLKAPLKKVKASAKVSGIAEGSLEAELTEDPRIAGRRSRLLAAPTDGITGTVAR